MKLKSDFAILDVTDGRDDLCQRFDGWAPISPPEHGIPVTISGFITSIHGEDDGVSREFVVHVTKVETE